MTISQAMNISRESLNNYQQALTVVSQNLANMNVDGYIKLRADFATNPCYNYGSNYYATIRGLNGASISSITSYANAQASQGSRAANAQAQYYQTMDNLMGRLSSISNELGKDGLQKTFESFFTAAQNLSANPTDPSARRLYIESAQNVAMKFNSISTSLDSLQEELVGNWREPSTINSSDIYMGIQDFNQGLEQIAEINKQILIAGGSGNTNGLINDRERILEQLSGYMDINVMQNDNGTVNISAGGVNLVSGAVQSAKLDVAAGDEDTPAMVQAKTLDDNVIYSNINEHVSGGQIGAILDMVNKRDGFITINDMKKQIDNMANTFATEVNNTQLFVDGDVQAMALGTDADGNTILVPSTEPIFNIEHPITAGNISVNKNVINDPSLVATARVDTSVADWEKNVGNTDNIVATSQLRDKKTMSTFGGAENTTFEGFLTYYAGNVGLQQKDIATKSARADALYENAKTNLQSLTGVNLDEELSDMIKFQRAYEASARMFNTANEIYQLLVNLGR